MSGRILLVDDEAELRDICREALTERGWTVLTAANGVEALEVLSSGRPVDLALLDKRMPRMDGVSLLKEMKRRNIDADVIFLTGYGGVDNAVECLQLGAVDYLLKPFNIDELTARLDKALGERRLRSSVQEATSFMDVLGFSESLKDKKDFSTLLQEFLQQTWDFFAPHGLAFFPDGHVNGEAGPTVWGGDAWHPSLTRWCKAVGGRLLDRNQPRLFDPATLANAKRAGNVVPQNLPEVSLLVVPMRHDDTRIGSLALFRHPGGSDYTQKELQYLTFFASHATVMLANALKDSRMRSINMGVITSFVRAVEAKDHYTSGHSERVSSYAVMLGRKMGLASKDLKLLRIAGLLHDIGKIGVPDHILNKPGPLTSQEYAVMKRHAEVGQDIVRRVIFLEEVLPLIYCHHERPDGLGYPEGLPLGDIPPLSRIISVVDGHEAMTSDRAYRQGMTYRDAMERLRRGAGSQWDERMVHTWLEIASSPSFSEEARKAAMAE